MFRAILANGTSADVLQAVYLCSNQLAPAYHNVTLNVAGSSVATALGEVCGVSRAEIRRVSTKCGDLGDAAILLATGRTSESKASRRQATLIRFPPLLINDVYRTMREIANEKGPGSAARRKTLVIKMLRACRECEIQYLVRTLVMNLRTGATLKTVLTSLAIAVEMHRARETVERVRALRDESLATQKKPKKGAAKASSAKKSKASTKTTVQPATSRAKVQAVDNTSSVDIDTDGNGDDVARDEASDDDGDFQIRCPFDAEFDSVLQQAPIEINQCYQRFPNLDELVLTLVNEGYV